MRNPSTSAPCCSKVGIKRGPWTPEEDKILSGYINKEGEGRWRTLPKRAGLQRCGKSCRLRWMNYLRPCVKRGRITPDEEDLILRLHRLLGNRWSLIAGRIPGRTDNEIKNYWNTHLSKKLISQGIDPRNHKPLNPSPPNTSSGQVAACDHNPTSAQELQEASSSHRASFINKGMGSNLPIENNPNSNPDPNLDKYQYDQAYQLAALTGGHNEDHYINKCNEVDTFSSFLDSLINESAFVTHHHQQPPPQLPVVSSSPHAFDHGSFWEAELIRSTMEMEDLKDMQNSINTHHQSI